MDKYVVIKEFADKNNVSKHFKVGDVLPASMGEARLKDIVSKGLAKAVKETKTADETKTKAE